MLSAGPLTIMRIPSPFLIIIILSLASAACAPAISWVRAKPAGAAHGGALHQFDSSDAAASRHRTARGLRAV